MILLIVSLLLGWLGPLTTVSAALGQAQLASAYDNLSFPVVSSHTATERGSPSTKRPSKTYDAVNARSRGAATRTVAAAPPAPPIYDDLVGHAHDPRVASTTHERWARGDSRVSWATALSGVAANTADEVSDALVLARGGSNTPERFASGSGVVREADGTLSGVSVNSGRTVEEAAQGIPHGRIGTTTVGDVRSAGGTVTLDPLEGNPGHCLLSGCTADTFSQLFTATIKNPGL